MSDIFSLTIEEILNDRAESVMDLETCQRLCDMLDLHDVDGPYLARRMEERIQGNQAIIRVIDAELDRRKE